MKALWNAEFLRTEPRIQDAYPSRCDIGLPRLGVRRLGYLLIPIFANGSVPASEPLVSTSLGEPATDLGQSSRHRVATSNGPG